MSDPDNAPISDSGGDAMLDKVVEKWPIDSRKARDAIHLYRTVTFLTIALEGVVGLVLLTLAIIMLLPVWESLEIPDLHPAFSNDRPCVGSCKQKLYCCTVLARGRSR